MAFDGQRQLVILGFGAIGAGLFAYEAQRSGPYAPPVVVDVRADFVEGLRADDGIVRVNIARADRVDVAEIGPLVVLDSSVTEDRARLVAAIASADELATALPSVALYEAPNESSPHRLIAAGLRARTLDAPLIVFCAENHRSAAARLAAAVSDACDPSERDEILGRARFTDTVIGKMSGVISDPAEVESLGLAAITTALASAFLVEEFDRILVSRVDRGGGLHPGMPVLREVDDLGQYEDAKLLGHNATHALGAVLATRLGLKLYSEIAGVPGAMAFLRTAFVDESGRALIARYAGVDPLFTPDGYADFADDLLARMVNPNLADTVERAARDPRRKLGWEDRMVGLIRVGVAERVPMPRYGMGIAAGLDVIRNGGETGSDAELLRSIWPSGIPDAEAEEVLRGVATGRKWLTRWDDVGFEGLPE